MRKFYSKLTALCMAGALAFTSFAPVGNLIGITSIEVQAETTSDTSWYNEGQTEFTISDEADLRGLADLVNGEDSVSFENCTIKMDSDINLDNSSAWTPIGNSEEKKFKGNFDGQNHVINNLFSRKDYDSSISGEQKDFIGLFGYVEGSELKHSTITNLSLNNLDIQVVYGNSPTYSIGDVFGIGGVVGYADQVDIENCNVQGQISASSHVGGVAGILKGNISNCSSEVNVSASLDVTGGVVAKMIGDLNNFLSANSLKYKGTITAKTNAGGIIGQAAYANITNCVVRKESSISVKSNGIAGGITSGFQGKIEQCINFADISCTYTTAYICGIALGLNAQDGTLISKCANFGKMSIKKGCAAGISTINGNAGIDNGPNKISYCYNFGEINGSNSAAMLGAITTTKNSQKAYTVTNSYTIGKRILANNEVEQIESTPSAIYQQVAYNSENGLAFPEGTEVTGITGYTTEQFKDRTVVDALNDGNEEKVWCQNTDYPDLAFNMILVSEITVPDTLSIAPGKTLKLQTSVTPDNATVKTLLYSISDDTIATVSEDGTVKGIKEGEAEITVKALDSGFSKTVKVTVKEPEPEKQPSTPSAASQPSAPATDNNTVASGTTVTVGTNNYIVTDNTSVAYAGTTNAKATKISIPATVKIGAATYKVTSVSANAFKGNKKIKSVTIGSNVTSIGKATFANCKKLTSVVIGKNVKTIGSKAFYGCSKLKKITVKSKVLKKVGSKAFKGIHKNAVIKVPSKKLKAYKKLLKGKGQKSSVNIK